MKIQCRTSSAKYFVFGFIFLLGAMLLSGCGSAEVDMTVYSDDTYSMVMQLNIPLEMLAYAGEDVTALEAELDEMVAQAAGEGQDVTWRKIKNDNPDVLGYEFRIKDAPISATEDFTWREVQFDKKTAYRMDFSNSIFSTFQSISFTLNAGEILDTNGTRVDSDTVRWVNPTARPYAIVIPKSRFNWIPFIAAFFLFLVLGFIVFILLVTGKLKQWAAAGFSTSKWRVQSIKLNSDQSRLQKEKEKEIGELGKKAWEARVSHPDYADTYNQLETMDAQRSGNQAHIKELEMELYQVQQTRTETNADFNTRIGEVQNKRKEVGGRLSQFQTDKSGFERRLSKAQKDVDQSAVEMEALRKRMESLVGSAAPDAAEQTNTLNNAISALERARLQNISDIPTFQSEISRLANEASLLEGEVKELDTKIAGLQEEQKNSLAPLDRQIRELQEKIRGANDENARLAREMTPLVEKLGPKVYQARPDAPALAEKFSQVNRLDMSLTDVDQQSSLLKARLATADSKNVLFFFIFLGVALVLLAAIVVLVILAFA